MNPARILTCLLLTGILAAGTSQGEPLSYGTQEIGISGLVDLDTAHDTRVELEATYGFMFLYGIEGGVRLLVERDDLLESYGLGGFAEYHMNIDTDLYPFVGGSLDLVDANSDFADEGDTALVLGLRTGIKYFITEQVALTGMAELRQATGDVFFDENDINDVDFRMLLGLRFYY